MQTYLEVCYVPDGPSPILAVMAKILGCADRGIILVAGILDMLGPHGLSAARICGRLGLLGPSDAGLRHFVASLNVVLSYLTVQHLSIRWPYDSGIPIMTVLYGFAAL